jgi:hypothetical protein
MAKQSVQTPATAPPAAAPKQDVRRPGDLLAPGPGTPWEDRGSIGVVGALFKTIGQSMLSPGKLLDSIRRAETASDARAFVFICGFFFGAAWVMNDYIALKRAGGDFDIVDNGYSMIAHLVLGVAGTWGLLHLIVRLFYKLVSAGEMTHKFPPVLAHNVYAYCLGPSILAFIPFYIGFAVALVWILLLFIYAAKTRLAIKPSGAIICNLIAAGGLFGVAVAAYWIVRTLVVKLYG